MKAREKLNKKIFEENESGDRFYFETCARNMGYTTIAGVDEVGRGALAGPVVAAAVILPANIEKIPEGIRDSKKLSPRQREIFFEKIVKCARCIGIGVKDNRHIDATSILSSSLNAMETAALSLKPKPDLVLVDGNQRFSIRFNQKTILKWDDRSLSIAAASIVAKVIRDRMMEAFHLFHPGYDFHINKGYGTERHLKALRDNGCCPIHRKSFKGVL